MGKVSRKSAPSPNLRSAHVAFNAGALRNPLLHSVSTEQNKLNGSNALYLVVYELNSSNVNFVKKRTINDVYL